MLSGVMMFEFMGWQEAARADRDLAGATIQQKKVTYDFERLMPGATKVKTSEFAGHDREHGSGACWQQSTYCQGLTDDHR